MPVHTLHFPYPEKVFTPVYFKLDEAKERFVINKGGTGSSKSFSAAQKEILIACQKRVNTLVIRKVSSTLRDSIIASFKSRITEFDIWDIWHENKTEMKLHCPLTKSQIIFKGLDDPEKMKSIEGINRILIEEATELEFEDFLELNRRVRGVKDIQITLNLNPIHEEHWIKKHFFDQEIPNCARIHSTYKDNPFLTPEDREQIEWLKQYNYNQYRIYALGEWGITENNAPWLFAFDMDKHVHDNLPFLPSYPVYLSFDFNRSPISCLAVQMSPNKGMKNSFVHFIREFSEDVQLKELCNRIKAAYPASILFVTGDASGSHGDVGYDNRNDSYYKMIQSYLRLNDKQMHLLAKNMEHNDSRNLCNTMFYSLPNLLIDSSCKTLINDCIIATVDETKVKAGVLKKDRDMYKLDSFDAMRYFFQKYFSEHMDIVRLLHK